MEIRKYSALPRICLLLLPLIFFVSGALTPARAQNDSMPVEGANTGLQVLGASDELGPCEGGPALDGESCNIPGDIVNPSFTPNKTTKPCSLDEKTGLISCASSQTHTKDETFTWGKKPAADYNLGGLKSMLDDARYPLTPKKLLEETTWNTNPQWDTWIARGCTFRKQDDGPTELVRNELSKERMQLGPDPNIPVVVGHLEYFKSTFSQLKKSNQNYQKATEKVDLASAYDCGYTKDATKVSSGIQESQGRGIWEILKIIFRTLLFDLTAKNNSWTEFTETARKPFSEEMAGGMIQATNETFVDSRVSAARKKKIAENAGIVETFRPCTVQFEGPEKDGEIKNQYEWASGEQFDQLSRQHLMKLVDESTNFLESALLPSALQQTKHKKINESKPCTYEETDFPAIPPNETITSSGEGGNIKASQCSATPGGGKTVSANKAIVEAAATKFKIPSCVLDGVAINEGAYIPAECKPNECGAMGPFQITVGHTNVMKGGQCTESKTCGDCRGLSGSKTCPDAISYYVPGAKPCDPVSAAESAAKMMIGKTKYYGFDLTSGADYASQKAAIIAAGDSYFGSAKALDGSFKNCSYGERVYKNCVGETNYTCVPHTLPTKAPTAP